MEPDPETFDEEELELEKKKRQGRIQQFNKNHGIKVKGMDCPDSLSNFTKIIQYLT
jgi:hypothetical protein